MSHYIPPKIRQHVQERANYRCEYCHLPDGSFLMDFQVDHIVALRHGGDDADSNMAWACFQCNNRKGTDMATLDPITRERTWLFHPRVDVWHDHFEINESGVVSTKTIIARATSYFLEMNAREQVVFRRMLMRLGRW